MTSKRKSFVLHKDSLEILPDLTDEQAGKLFKAIYAYQIDEEIKLDQIIKMVFLPFKNQFARDDSKYLETCERRAIAGSKGGKQKVANASKSKQTVANLPVTVTDTVNVTVTDNDILLEKETKDTYTFKQFWNDYGKKVDKTKCSKKFAKLTEKEKFALKEKVPQYVISTPEVQYRKNPLTYLNGKCWEDEIITKNTTQNETDIKTEWNRAAVKNQNELW